MPELKRDAIEDAISCVRTYSEMTADEAARQLAALTERTDRERAVLEACKTVERASLEYYVHAFGDETGWGAVSAAELARRAVSE